MKYLSALAVLVLAGGASAAAGQDQTGAIEIDVSAERIYVPTTATVTQEQLESQTAEDAIDALRTVSGLDISYGHRLGFPSIAIRGRAFRFVQVIMDGIPINLMDAHDLVLVPVDCIKKIEVIKGPVPVYYGLDTSSGVVLITTKNGREFPGVTERVLAGEDNRMLNDVAAGGGDDKFDYHVTYHYDENDTSIAHSEYRNNLLYGKFNLSLGQGARLQGVGSYYNGDKNMPNSTAPPQSYMNQVTSWDVEFRDWERRGYALVLESDLGDWGVGMIRHSYQDNKFNRFESTPTARALSREMGQITRTEVRIEAAHRDRMIFRLGLQRDVEESDPTNSVPAGSGQNPVATHYERETFGYYAEETWRPSDWLEVVGGIRIDDPDTSDYETNPNIGARWTLWNGDVIHAAAGRMVHYPSMEQLYGSGNVPANPALHAESTKASEIGWQRAWGNKGSVQVVLHEAKVKDAIDRLGPQYPFENGAGITYHGGELELRRALGGGFEVDLNYADLTAQDQRAFIAYKSIGSPIARHRARAAVHWAGARGWKVEVDAAWVDERPSGDREVEGVKQTLDAYTLVNLQIRKDWGDIEAFARVENLLDEEYEEMVYYPAPGRTFSAGLTRRW
jgi:vitamin B12 transporter